MILGFASTWSCSCGLKFGAHTTVFESREDRMRLGKPVDDLDRMTEDLNVPMNMGGLTSF
jgi:Protein FAM221A/B